jgi:hypothetical protein
MRLLERARYLPKVTAGRLTRPRHDGSEVSMPGQEPLPHRYHLRLRTRFPIRLFTYWAIETMRSTGSLTLSILASVTRLVW